MSNIYNLVISPSLALFHFRYSINISPTPLGSDWSAF